MYPCSLGSCQNNQCTSKKKNFSSKVALCFLNFTYIHMHTFLRKRSAWQAELLTQSADTQAGLRSETGLVLVLQNITTLGG